MEEHQETKECKPQYFFSFSSGTGHGYCINSMYVCDHVVTAKEWGDFCKNYEEELERKIIAIPRLETGGLNYKSKEYIQTKLWMKENNPEATFIVLHNMWKLAHTELWRNKPHFEIMI